MCDSRVAIWLRELDPIRGAFETAGVLSRGNWEKDPKWSSNTAVDVVMGWSTIRARVLMRKLNFLRRLVLGDGNNLGSRMMRSLTDDAESVCLVRECRELEEAFGTSYTDRILMIEEGECPHPRVMREDIVKRDREAQLVKCSLREKSPVVADVAGRHWEKLWDAALDEGARCIEQMRGLVRMLCHKCFGDGSSCPYEHHDVTEDMMNSLSRLNFDCLQKFRYHYY